MKIFLKYWPVISFVEGGVIMGLELVGAKMLAPVFGVSTFVWAAILSISLGGLAMGYFVGSLMAEKGSKIKVLGQILLLASLYILAMPFIARFCLTRFLQLELITGLLLTTLAILLVPTFILGLISPLMVAILDQKAHKSYTGKVMAISTLGGVIITLFLGLYLIPLWGIRLNTLFMGAVLGLSALLLWTKELSKWMLFWTLILFLMIFLMFQKAGGLAIKVLYKSEGVLGQILVAKVPYGKSDSAKVLFSNRIAQSMLLENGTNGANNFDYINKLVLLSDSIKVEKPKALILGLGAGGAANGLIQKGYKVDACELDKRVVEVARNFFELSVRVNVQTMDARPYVNKLTSTYDLIFMDLFKGEEIPAYTFTLEAFQKLKTHLSGKGCIVINASSFVQGKDGAGMRSILKTISTAQLQVTCYKTDEGAEGSVFIVATNPGVTFDLSRLITPLSNIDFSEDVVLTDDRCPLDLLMMSANKKWREGYSRHYTSYFTNAGVPLFF